MPAWMTEPFCAQGSYEIVGRVVAGGNIAVHLLIFLAPPLSLCVCANAQALLRARVNSDCLTDAAGSRKLLLIQWENLIQATQESNVNIPQMADTLFERAGNASWIVVFKALGTTHHLMVHGNERFIQFLASRNTLFNLSNFLDKTGSQGYDMSTFIRRYSRYLNEKAFAYRQMAFDFVRVKKGAEGVMRTMSTDKLLKGMPTLQSQIDALLEFDVHPQDLKNGVINAAFLLLFKDLIKLYACYNDGIINLLEKFFQMKKGQCKDALEIYKRFLTRMTRVSEFLKIAEQVGIDKNDIPELTQLPESLLESLETHLNTLEGKKV
ncbi:hypothetical protein ACEWY4_020336 [Coilia grayii]|uniref:ENTH domain-containing protein n=1 Tax=Coilia grayii TaxID=363190 RepID=A0ABD1JCB0_9TELE